MKKMKASNKAETPEVEEKAPEITETVNDGAPDAPSEPAADDKVEEPAKEPEKTPEPPAPPPAKVEAPKPVSAGADGKVPCKALKTVIVGGMVRYEGQTFRQFVELAQKQADRGDLEILG